MNSFLRNCIVTIFFTLVSITSVYAQPPNDNCSSPTALGTLGAPAICAGLGVNVGATTTSTNQTTVAATSPNPYVYLTACSTGTDMSNPALDTWYTFIASGNSATITITDFPNANVGVYSGTNCSTLNGIACAIMPAVGPGTLTFTVVVGQTYYLQISGNTLSATDANFTIAINNSIDCNGCLTASSLVATPPPANGVYSPGQVVRFCYTVSNFEHINVNWLHGVQINMGPGWTGVVTNVTSPAACQGTGTWAFFPSGIGIVNSINWGSGFYFDTTDTGANPANNLGDNCSTDNWQFCWDMTVSSTCIPGQDVSVTVNTSGDGESGSWSSNACNNDLPTKIIAVKTDKVTMTNPNAATICSGSTLNFPLTTSTPATITWIATDNPNVTGESLTLQTSTNINNTLVNTSTVVQVVTYTATPIPTGICPGLPQTISITVSPAATANAGTGSTICAGAGSCVNLSGSVTNAASSVGPISFSNNGSYAIPDDNTFISSPILVSGITPSVIGAGSIASVCININHTFDADLDIFLESPDGTRIILSTDNGGSNDNYTGTCFSPTAVTAITAGAANAPFTGSFLPEGLFSALNTLLINGTWKLFVKDDTGGDIGNIVGWTITFNNNAPAFSWSPTTAMTNSTTLTPTVCPTVTTTYTLTANGAAGCGTATSPVTVTVTTVNTVGAASATPTLCINTALTAITHATTGATGIGTATGLPLGVTAAWATNTITISGTPTASGTFPYSIPLTGGCGTVTATGTITVNPIVTPSISCGTSTINSVQFIWQAVANATGYSVSYQIWAGAFNPGTPILTGTTYTLDVTGLTSGSTVTIRVTPTGPAGTCFGQSSIACPAVVCPTILTPTASQSLCINGTPTPISVNTTFTAANSIKFVYFNLPQSGTTMYTYTLANLLSDATPAATGVASYTLPALGVAGSLPNVAAIYYVYAIANPTPTDPGCRPYQLIQITVNPLHTLTLSSAVATETQTTCAGTAITDITYTLGGGATSASVTGLPTGVTFLVSGTILTISGIPTASAVLPFGYSITTSGNGCTVATDSGTITVNPLHTLTLSSAVATETQTTCAGTAITDITYTLGGGATSASVTGLPTGVTFLVSGTILTISGIPTASAVLPLSYTITTSGNGCTVATDSGTITVNPLHTLTLSSAVATETQTTCAGTAITDITYTLGGGATSASVTGLPTGVTFLVSGTILTISGIPTASAVLPLSYTITTSGNGCTVATDSGTITVNPLHTLTLSSAVATETQTTCAGTAITDITYTLGGGATSATVTGLPTGVTFLVSGTILTISGIPTASAVLPLSYTITTSGNGCTVATDSGTITVNPLHTLTLSSAVATETQTTCAGTVITDITYTLGGGATGATVTGLPTGVTFLVSGTILTISGTPTTSAVLPFGYTITTSGNTCTPFATDSGTITVNPLHTLTLSSAVATETQTTCAGTAITDITYTLGGGATSASVTGLPTGVTFLVSGTILTISGSPTASAVLPLSYTITTSGNGCTVATDSGTITVNPLHTLTLSSAVATETQTTCAGTAITDITYTLGGGATSASVTGLPTGVTFLVSGTILTISGIPTASAVLPLSYTITTSGNGCTVATDSGTITVNPLHTLTLSSAVATETQTTCAGTVITDITYTLGGGATGATVTGLPTGVTFLVSGTILTISGSPTASAVLPFGYTITTSGNTCTPFATDSGTITVNPLHTLTLSSAVATETQTTCAGTAITDITYTLGGGATSASVTGLPLGVTALVSGTTVTISGIPTASAVLPLSYTITTSGNGCTVATDSGTITVNPLHTLTLSSAVATETQTTCAGTAITDITYTLGGGATSASVTGLPTGVTFLVSGTILTISGIPTASAVLPLSYTITTSGNGCTVATDSGTITVNPLHTLTLSSAVATETQTTCAGTAITDITYTLGGGATGATVTGLPTGVTFLVSGTILTISGIPTASAVLPLSYTITTSGNGCTVATDSGTITVNPLHTLTLSSAVATETQTTCAGTAITDITYTLGGGATSASVTGLPTGVTFLVSGTILTISGIPTASAVLPLSYTITTSGNGCTVATDSGTITVNPLHTLTLSSAVATETQTTCAGTAITDITYTLGGGATGATVTGLPTGVTALVSGTTVTISGSPTASAVLPFGYSITTSGNACTPFATDSGTITVNPLHTLTLSSAVATETQTTCAGTAITDITYTLGGGATSASVTGLPTGVTFLVSGTILTISGIPTASAVLPLSYTITTSGNGCTVATDSGTITVNPLHTLTLSSAVATETQITCAGTAITNITYTLGGGATGATVTGLPLGVTFLVSGTILTISGTPTTSAVLPFGYTITTSGNTCTPFATDSGTITVNPLHTLTLSSAVATETQITCAGTAITNITYTLGGGATGATVTGLPLGVTFLVSGTILTISGTPTTSAVLPFGYTITTSGNTCTPFATDSGTITVNPLHTLTLSSAVATETQITCAGTAITNITYTLGGGATGATVTGLPLGVTFLVSGTILTISGTPTTSAVLPFGYTITTSGNTCTPFATDSGTITVNPLHTLTLSSAVATETQITCAGTAITNITYTLGGGATGATVTGLPLGVTFLVSGTILTISGTPTTSAVLPFGYTITTSGNTCTPFATDSGTITVNPLHTLTLSSAVATETQITCAGTAITNITYTLGGGATGATVTGLPLGVTFLVSGTILTISGTPTTSAVLPFGYTITTSGNTCTPFATDSGTITVNPLHTLTLSSVAATETQTTCAGTAITDITYTLGGGATSATVTGLPLGVTFLVSGTILTISGIPTTSAVLPFDYTITTSGNGCTVATDSGTITVNPLHTLTLSSVVATETQTTCAGTAITDITYTLGGGATSATVTGLPLGVTFLVSGTTVTISGSPTTSAVLPFGYSITTSGNGCTVATDSGTITVNPLHTLTLSSVAATETQTTCAGTAITDITYTLGGGATSATVTGLPLGVTFSVSGTILTISGTPTTSAVLPFGYTITTSGNTCTPFATDSGTITVNPLHTLTLSSAVATETQITCAGTAITNITYTLGGGATGATVTGLPLGVTFLVSGTILTISGTPTTSAVLPFGYTITTSGNTCTPFATDSGTITVNPVPTIIATPTTETLCSLQSTGISLSSSIPTATFSWTISSTVATGATAGTGNAISQVLTATGTVVETVVYTATSFANGCFSTPINIPILVTPKPTAITTPSLQSICSGNAPNIVLTGATPGTTFTWNSVATNVTGASSGTTAIISQPLTTIGDVIGEAVYSITPLLNGCPGLPILVTIKVNPIPVISANPMNAIICSGETTAIDLTSSVPGTTYSWSVLQTGLFGTASGSGSQINQTLTTVGLVSGDVVYIITPTVNGCAGIPIRVTVLVNPTPELFGSPTQLPICSGEDTQIILTPNIIGTTFAWTATQNGVTGAFDGTGGSIIQTLETTGTTFGIASYAVTPTLNSCVGNTITISVRVNPLPTPSLLDGIICEDLAGNLLNPYVLNTGLGTSNLEFEWYFNGVIIPGEVGNTLSAEESGIYSVQVKNLTTGCISLQTATSATVIPKNPGLSLVAEASIAFSDDASIIATVTGGSGDFEYSLDNGSFQTSNIFTPVESGSHIVVVRDINGCTDLTASALVIGYPTYFTPNGDSYHESWNIIGFDLINNAKIYIFDRYGKLIKQINPLGQGWDGTYNETPMPSTDYWFTTDYFDAVENKNKVFKSHFSLKR